jgi:hypothetical protein
MLKIRHKLTSNVVKREAGNRQWVLETLTHVGVKLERGEIFI